MMKERICNVITNIAEWVVIVLMTTIIAYVTSLIYVYCFNTENSIPAQSKVFFQLIALLAVIEVGWLLGHYINGHPKMSKWISAIFFVCTLIFVGIVCWSYVSETLIWPTSDSKSCFDIALRFYQSEFGAVVPEGSYLSLWPFQTGLIFILEKTMRLFQDTSPLLFQKINCVYVLMTIASGYGTVCSITKRIEGRIIYLCLMATYWPLIFSVSDVYGDIPALGWMMFSCMCFIWYHRTEIKSARRIYAVLFAAASVIACTYKRNCLIYVIAFLLVAVILQLRKQQFGFLLLMIITAVLSMSATSITQRYYEYYAGNICGKGVPAIAYLAMGLQYNGEEPIPGGWNGFHSNTYMETGYDYDETVKRSIDSINESMNDFSQSPKFMLHFFHNKVLKQWANQTHGIYWGGG